MNDFLFHYAWSLPWNGMAQQAFCHWWDTEAAKHDTIVAVLGSHEASTLRIGLRRQRCQLKMLNR